MIALRPYQLDAVERVRGEVRAGSRRVLVVLPTGGGKTVVAAHIVTSSVALGKRVLFVAHRRELLHQCYRKLVDAGLSEQQLGVVMAGDTRRRPNAPVQIASIDTLRNRAKPIADLVIVDEAHRALAKSYRDLAAAYPRAVHLGLTATPYRADGRGLGDAYDVIVVVATPKELVALGFLVEPRVFTVPESELPDLSGVRIQRGDYDERDLARAVNSRVLVGNIVAHWRKLADGRRTVAFAVSVEHSRHIVERFREANIHAEHLDGATSTRDRDAILARLQSGETRVVSNCGVLCEGWDQPSVKCCILARPTKSTGLYLQQAGRILRPWENTEALILDHAGCAITHGLPQDDREYTLDAAPKKRAASKNEPRAKPCPACRMLLTPQARACSNCSLTFLLPDAVPIESEAELVEISAARISAMPTGYAKTRAAFEHLRRFKKLPAVAHDHEAQKTPSSPELGRWRG